MASQPIPTLSVSARLLIEQCDDGALVFDPDSGATTFLNDRVAALLKFMQAQGCVAEAALHSAMAQLWGDVSDVANILSSLEKSRLISRC